MKKAALFVLTLLPASVAFSQGVKIADTGSAPHAASILEMEATDRGFLVPRLTSTEREAMPGPIAAGLTIFNTTTGCTNVYNGAAWFEFCGNCLPQPSAPNAGTDQSNLSGTISLSGNSPTPGNTGLWSIVSGSGGSFSGSPTSSVPTASFSGTAGSTYVLRWTHTNVCGSAQDDVQLNFCPAVSTANAGSDQLNLLATSATLSGNAPGAGNTGVWTITSGSGGSFAGSPTSTNPTAVFSGLPSTSYTLTWTHSTACTSTNDAVIISFSAACPATLTDIDNNVYNVIQIGTQCWMKENLKTTKYRNNAAIDYPGSNNSAWLSNTTGAYAWYNNTIGNGSTYGALYNWAAATSGNGLCPTGWHVPTDPEWTTLVTFLGGQTTGGGPMKSITGWNSPNSGASNLSNFTALPGGFRSGGDGNFYSISTNAYLWSTTQNPGATTNAWGCYLASANTNALRNDGDKKNGFSVRCIRD